MQCNPWEIEVKKDEKKNIIPSSFLQLKDKEWEDLHFIRFTRANTISRHRTALSRLQDALSEFSFLLLQLILARRLDSSTTYLSFSSALSLCILHKAGFGTGINSTISTTSFLFCICKMVSNSSEHQSSLSRSTSYVNMKLSNKYWQLFILESFTPCSRLLSIQMSFSCPSSICPPKSNYSLCPVTTCTLHLSILIFFSHAAHCT